MLKLGVLISGGGTNLQALIDNQHKFVDTSIELVVSNKDSYGLVRASRAGIENLYIDPKNFRSQEEYNRKLLEEFKSREINFIVLAGYLKILSKDFVEGFKGKIINIHPSLLPSFSGDGFYGDRVHRAVLESGETETGATVHFVDKGIDTGPIILQGKVAIEEGETVKSLKAKVLELEHEILVEVVRLVSEGNLELSKNNTVKLGCKYEEKSYY